ncbi:putative conserved mitochondrial protein [Phaeomoniella chlamydospora]|uniref:Putative conserved mitochondrial protein n=1 Tax=Phaeomoniella chlamydospora TaxID=158046 RepID=A0A0G2EAE4_PHACM|nr:putative conserved mitochondrial protein [Phaeomoniella chlamydospora]
MSKLSQPLKELISAAHAKPGPVPAPKNIRSIFDSISKDAASKKVGLPAWLTLSTATTMTMNSPESLLQLHDLVSSSGDKARSIYAAELMREVGLKCISFNGIPRTINMLGAFHSGLPSSISSSLSTTPTRNITPSNLTTSQARGRSLWNSVYIPFQDKLLSKLGESHPDLPVHILESHYAGLLSDPVPVTQRPSGAKVGRILTSLTALACLRSQTGVGPQVTSHVFGLRKAFGDGSFEAEGEEQVEGAKWLATDEGSIWALQLVDSIVSGIGEGRGTSFAPGIEKAKL